MIEFVVCMVGIGRTLKLVLRKSVTLRTLEDLILPTSTISNIVVPFITFFVVVVVD